MLESISSSSRTIKLVVEYDGSELCGWQRQSNGPTVQQHLEEAVRSMTHEETIILGASRTDAGVHALAQVCIFKTERAISPFGFRQGLNSALPDFIGVRSVEEMPAGFHPRYDATGKHYKYTLLNRETPSPLLRLRSWHRPMPLDVDVMQSASRILLGEHDFSAFRASGCGAKTPHRRIDKIDVKRAGDLVNIEVWGNAFLRNMVRIIAGTLVDIGSRALRADQLKAILQSRDRRHAGQTAPPQGLCLMEVFFKSAPGPNERYRPDTKATPGV